MRCKNCGFETPNNSNFCSHCGTKIDFEDNFINTEEVKEIKEEPKTVTKEDLIKEQYPDIDLSKASILWYFLGFFVPMAGIVLFFVFLYKKPDLAFKARRGALHGFIVECILLFVYYIILYSRGGVM